MEDSYLASCQGSANADADPLLIFGVFDGHGGEEVAEVVAKIGKEKILRCVCVLLNSFPSPGPSSHSPYNCNCD